MLSPNESPPRFFTLLLLAWCLIMPSAHGAEIVRIMAANTTSGNSQSYDDPGVRIFQGLDPDIVLIQEFNYGDDSPNDIRDLVDLAFGAEFYYFREGGDEQLPNGIISRYPIIASGEWQDSEANNRDFAWARIDIPGAVHLWVVSVHFLTSDGNERPAQAAALVNHVQNQVPAGDYLVIGGDFNADVFSEQALNTLATVVTTSGRPNDQNGNTFTNASRSKPYDQILPGSALKTLETPVTIPGHSTSYSDGLVFDSRVFTPLSAVTPVTQSDSGVSGMQHMAVIRDFLIPDNGATEPSAYPSDFAGSPTETSITLNWADVTSTPIPDAYLIKASSNPNISPPVDGMDATPDSDLSDGSAQIIVNQNTQSAGFTGLPFETTYHFQIFPFTDEATIDYKTDGSPPELSLTSLADSSNIPAAPLLGSFYYVHGNGFTATWDQVGFATNYRFDISESPTFSGVDGALLIDETFDTSTSVPAAWSDSGTANDTLSSHYNSAANCRALGSGDGLETPAVDSPTQLSFYVDSSGGGNGNIGTVSYSIGAGAWQNLGSFPVSTDGATETFDLTTSPNLSTQADVRFRFESDFNTWYLDDVLVSGPSDPAFVPGYENIAVGDIDRLSIDGLDVDTDYYLRLRAENASGTSADSSTAMVTTRISGTPFENWSSDNGISPANPNGDSDGDSLSDFGEYVFDTDPSLPSSDLEWQELTQGEGVIQLTHRRSIAPGITWNYLGSTNLQNFSTPMSEGLNFAQYQIISVIRSGNYDEITLNINTESAPRFFIRIEATSIQ